MSSPRLFTIFTLIITFALTFAAHTTAVASGCFPGGAYTNYQFIDNNIASICQSFSGWYGKGGAGRELCLNSGLISGQAKSFDFSIYNTNSNQDQFMRADGCVEFMKKIDAQCPHGGNFFYDDLHWQFILDPNDARC